MLWLWLYEVKQKKQPHLEVNFEYTANVCRNVFLYVSVCDPICMYVCMNVCVCVGGGADSKVYLRWLRQLHFLSGTECQTFEVSTISVFVLSLKKGDRVI